jgi:hypothetical protein
MQALAPFPVSTLSPLSTQDGTPLAHIVYPLVRWVTACPQMTLEPRPAGARQERRLLPTRAWGVSPSMGFDVRPRLLALIDQTGDLAGQFLCQHTRRGAPKTARAM